MILDAEHDSFMLENGLYIKRLDTPEGSYELRVVFMLFGNRRLVLASPGRKTYERGWCYRGPNALVVAGAEALKWPEDADPFEYTPDRWYKDVVTGKTQQQFFQDALGVS